MAGDIRVVAEGLDGPSRSTRPPTPPWMWVIVGLLIGLGAAVVFFTPASTEPPVEAVAEDDTPDLNQVDAAEVDPTELGASEVIEAFPDGLVGVAMTETQSLDHVLWPPTGTPQILSLPVGAFGEVKFDSTGTRSAVSTKVPGRDGDVLSMGKARAIRPLASDVTSFTWHDSEPAQIAYTEISDGGWTLRVAGADRNPEVVTDDLAVRGTVGAFGDWGFAIQTSETQITLLTPTGELRTTASGRILDSHPQGWVLVFDQELVMMSAGGGLRSLEVDHESIGGVLGASLSPDLRHVAMIGGVGLKIASIDGPPSTIEVPFTAITSATSWSSDGRFAVVPLIRGLVVVDTVNGSLHEVLEEHAFIATGVIPLTS